MIIFQGVPFIKIIKNILESLQLTDMFESPNTNKAHKDIEIQKKILQILQFS